MVRSFSVMAGLLLGVAPLAAAAPDFDQQIAPLFAARCLSCHSGPKPKGDLDLSRKQRVLGGANAAVIPGKAAESELWKRIAAGEMPPKKPLPDAEAKLIEAWIAAGAKWGTDPIDPFRFTTSSRAGYDWWALQPIARPTVPKAPPDKRAFNEIDRFLLAKQPSDLKMSSPADRRTLIRRVSFDLVGLPPSHEETAAFLRDDSPDAYEKLVDRLLASPHHGERWARHWLDVVRYGETDGFERNASRPTAWHYRDWVIRALNADMPYDEFARRQLAGDVLYPNDAEAIRATGFLVAAVHNTVLGNDQMRRVARQDELEDLVGGIGQTFLGLTVNCARCHDHKFDPISQADYYRLAAAVAGVNPGERPLPDAKRQKDLQRLTKDRDAVREKLAAIEAPARRAALARKGIAAAERIAPAPVAAWDFRDIGDNRIGSLQAKAIGAAKLTPDGAQVDGKTGFFRTPPLPFDLNAKTIEAWVRLDSLTQRGGGVMSIQTPEGNEFDAIVFGEREPGRWMAGSNNFVRTQSFGAPAETDAQTTTVHVAIAYSQDGRIAAYRNGKPYGRSYASPGLHSFSRGKAVVVFGCRHEPAGGNKMLAGTIRAARLYDRALSEKEVGESYAAGPYSASDAEIDAELGPDQRRDRASLRMQVRERERELGRLMERAANVRAYANVPIAPGVTRVLGRGDINQPGAIVGPAGLACVNRAGAAFGLPPDASDAERRKKLAAWITSPTNPLFARVMVNRVWHYHFGMGLVETPSDFGFNGGRPSHPKLLDWLAGRFIERRYSLKDLHKIIVMSAAYRQSSGLRKNAMARDANDRLLWRFAPHRLDGESIRDAMLAVSGLLNREVGGRGFSDYRERNFNGTAYFDPFDPLGSAFQRRSIYRFAPRGANRGLLDAFDCPDPAAAAPRRASTTTPLQALTLWNNGFVLRAAEAFAQRIGKEAKGIDRQVVRVWQLAYQRDPTAEEAKWAGALVRDRGLKALCRVVFNSNEFVTVE